MPSPIVANNFCDAQIEAGSSLCAQLKKFFSLPRLLCQFFRWFLDDAGNPTAEFQATLTQVAIPPGFINAFGGSGSVAGWLVCNGQSVSRETYAALFSAIGTAWGVGDGITTFNVPNLASKTLRGVGSGETVGTSGGADSVVLVSGQLPAHSHTLALHRSAGNPTAAGNYLVRSDVATTGFIPAHTETTDSAGADQPVGIIPSHGKATFLIKT
jgi:microcystin-dependent protein